MNRGGTVTILGCGSSGGVPRVGQGWGACDPAEPRNRRRRCSILIDFKGQGDALPTTVLVDTSPDLREQLLDADVKHLDAVVITHEHADHTHGLDDLRPLTMVMRRRVDVFADRYATESLVNRFGYCFATPAGSPYPPILRLHTVECGRPLEIAGRGGSVEFETFPLTHGEIEVLGLRFNKVAYTPDVSRIPDGSIAYLEHLDLWIIDALRPTPHPTHFSLSEALDWIERLKPKRAILTNLHSDLDYGSLASKLPAHIVPAHDGMRIEFA
ncbi:MAG TPA: MBL fold metallo-hydrolase [Beijerinckiaceae bacterium]|nr:MBL fold metallo-hydrolase [Beijerinckiaceae bacterium]